MIQFLESTAAQYLLLFLGFLVGVGMVCLKLPGGEETRTAFMATLFLRFQLPRIARTYPDKPAANPIPPSATLKALPSPPSEERNGGDGGDGNGRNPLGV